MANLANHHAVPEKDDEIAARSATEPTFRERLMDVLPHLRAYGRALTGSADQADDLVQDTIVRLLTAQDQFKPGTNFRAWAIAILRNRFIDLRRRARFVGAPIEDVGALQLSTPAVQETAVYFEETAREFWRLNPAHREIMTMIGINGMTYDKAAEVLGCPIGTVRSRLARARAELQAAIDGRRRADRARAEHRAHERVRHAIRAPQ